MMAGKLRVLERQLTYRLPRIRLCMVYEDVSPETLYSIRTAEDAEEFLTPLRWVPEEHFVSLHLNAKNEVIGLHEVSHGSLSTSVVHPREVFKAALVANSYAILICHNHPSGSRVSPSPEDLSTTRQLLMAGMLLAVPIIDHLIFSPTQSAYSMRQNHPELWGD